MQSRNLFGVGIRLIGVWEILSGFEELVTYANVVMRLFTPSLTSPNGYLTHAVAHLLIGFVLLFWTTSVANGVLPSSEVAENGSSDQS